MKQVFGTKTAEYAPPALVLAVTIVYLLTAYTYSPEARAFPLTVAWAALALASLDLVSRTKTQIGETLIRWLNPAAAPDKADLRPHYPAIKQLTAIAWVVAFVALMALIGILYAVPVFVFASMFLRGKRVWWLCLLVSAGIATVIWFLFEQVLGLELYRGILFGAL